jgi:hypothetical protein
MRGAPSQYRSCGYALYEPTSFPGLAFAMASIAEQLMYLPTSLSPNPRSRAKRVVGHAEAGRIVSVEMNGQTFAELERVE